VSRWSPETLQVALFPARVIATKIESGWRTRVIDKRVVETADLAPDPSRAGATGSGQPGADPAWKATVAALDEVLAGFTTPGIPATVIVSSRFVRYIIVPWRDNVIGATEQAEFARHCFSNVYGATSVDWEIRISSGGFRRNALASAVDAQMLRAVEKVVTGRGFRIASIQPNFMAACNRFRRELGGYQSGCIAVLEPGRVALGIFDRTGWRTLSARRVDTPGPAELVSVLAQELKLAEPADLPEFLFVAALGPTMSSFFRTRTKAWMSPRQTRIPDSLP
jgi:hypothetical protein